MMQLVAGNDRVVVRGASDAERDVLDGELRYQASELVPSPERAGAMDWDGWVRMLSRPTKAGTSHFSTGLLPRALRICAQMGVKYELVDKRVPTPIGEAVGKPVPLFAYQLEAVDAAIKAQQGVIDLPPRSGKTRCLTEVVRRIGHKTLWIAPTGPIVRQTTAVASEFLGSKNVKEMIGAKNQKAYHKTPVVCCTAAAAGRVDQSFLDTRQCLVVDEWHHAAAKSYHTLFKRCSHIYWRYGMTGTHFRSGSDAMAMEALLSNTIYTLPAERLRDLGRLVPCDVVMLGTHFPRMRGLNPYQFINSVGRFGAFEHVGRQHLIARAIAMLIRRGRTVLVLVRTIAQGRMLLDMVQPMLPPAPHGCRFRTCEFLCGQDKRQNVDGVLASYNAGQEVKAVIGTSLVGEGCDLPAADALIYAACGRAEVPLVQNAFRVCTATEGKVPRALILDFADNHVPKLLDQAVSRMNVYASQRIFETHVLSHARELVPWLDAHQPMATDHAQQARSSHAASAQQPRAVDG